jgi:nucleoside phosphorylase
MGANPARLGLVGEARPAFGLLTALPNEFAAVKASIENSRIVNIPGRGAGRRYTLGTVPAAGGGQHKVVAALGDMGTNIASARAALLLQHFKSVRYVVMVGIAGGVPWPEKAAEHVRLGDIVVSGQNGVVQYDFVKETVGKIVQRNPPRPVASALLEIVRSLQADELEGSRPLYGHLDRILLRLGIARPNSRLDVLASEVDPRQKIRHPRDAERVPGRPRVFVGAIASANRLLKNPKRRDELRNRFGVKAVEMEGAGIADATWNHEAGYLVVRGVCDYCDSKKGDVWQNYAAAVAAAYVRTLLEAMPIDKATEDDPAIFNRTTVRIREMKGDLVVGNKYGM